MNRNSRSSCPQEFLRKGVLRICSKFTGQRPCRSVISIKLQNNFIEMILWHGCSPVNLLHIFRLPFPKNTFGWLLLEFVEKRLIVGKRYSWWVINPLLANIPILYPLKTSENRRLFGLFKGYKMQTLVINGSSTTKNIEVSDTDTRCLCQDFQIAFKVSFI